MQTHTLLLTPWMSPHNVVPWERAMTLLVEDKIDVLETYDGEVIRTSRESFPLPSVARIKRPIHGFKKGVKFSRVNVFTRDGFTCCYCGTKKPMSQLNYDHVVPRIQGGKTDWENIVTSCYECNSKKRDRTPAQAGMTLRRKPIRPKVLPMTTPTWATNKTPKEWLPYLGVQSSGWATAGIESAVVVQVDTIDL
jgi:5-methylcytosine-specific restriction endonuclease McrA